MKEEVKIIPLGGQAENGKSMYCVEVNNNIFIVDCGYRFPEVDKLGVDIIIPDFSYLVANKQKIKGIIITHGHNDVMAALPYFLNEIEVPVYASKITSKLIEQTVNLYNKNNKKVNLKLEVVDENGTINISGVNMELFSVTHSIPGAFGLAIETKKGYIVYASEFIIDFGAPEIFASNIQKMMEIGKKGVLALMVESSYAKHTGYTSPNHKLTDKIQRVFNDAKGRIIITSYAQNIFRVKEIVELTKKYNRQIVFYGRDKYDVTNTIYRLSESYPDLAINQKYVAPVDVIGKAGFDDNLVVLLSGDPRHIYRDILDIVSGGDNRLKLNDEDNFIIASPVLPGTEMLANQAINELYKTDIRITLLKSKSLFSMHASQEDIKVVLKIFKPKYYIPIKGEYQHFIANQDIALDLGYKKDRITIVDNGEIITFKDGKMESYRDTIEVEDVMIDGSGIGDVGDKVIGDRIQLGNDGVVIIGVTIDSKTKKIITAIDVQTRGFVYLKDSQDIINQVLQITEKEILSLEKEPKTDIIEIRQKIKDQVTKYLVKTTAKKPVVLPVVVEV